MDFEEMKNAVARATQDDIVYYLRGSRTRFNRHAEAADEIERLRAEVRELTSEVQRLHVADL